jgi:hypothetical protein
MAKAKKKPAAEPEQKPEAETEQPQPANDNRRSKRKDPPFIIGIDA